MDNALVLLGFLIEMVFILYLSKYSGIRTLTSIVIVNMILISILGKAEISLFGLTSNLGVIFYASVFTAFSLMIVENGRIGFLKTISTTLFKYIFFIVMLYWAIHTPHLKNDDYIQKIHELLDISFQIATASFIAFYAGNLVNFFFLNLSKSNLYIKKTMGNWLGQFIDSLFFFPIAFYGVYDMHNICVFIWQGTIIKCILNILDIPFFYVALKIKKTYGKN